MTGFRTSPPGGRPSRFASGAIGGSPLSQAQIMHLMKTEFARARRYGFPLSCLLIQVDRLQALADLHGAELKDTVREQLVRLVEERTRGADHLGLVTDDRLLLVLPHTGEAQAAQVAERIQQQFRELEISVNGQPLALALSFGVATCADQETLFFDTVLAHAEVALEWAVEAGGGKVSVFRKERYLDRPSAEGDAGPASDSPADLDAANRRR
jgi:diguanylate cyclase (GGDEF)-like protein